ncbi:restriction endonuclease [Fictibacillus arsenicus]|nr:restriction endonuclease [Fictibacillus arsenicus]
MRRYRSYRVRTYRTRGKKVKLSPLQTVDFMAIWLLLMLTLLYFLSTAGEIYIVDMPIFWIGILVIFILYLPLRWILAKEERENEEKILQSGIMEIDLMEGVQFERYLELLFLSMGYNVQTTSATGDFGADLILKKDNRTIVVQVKRYNKTVGVKAVQEVYSSMPYYQATEGWVVTNNTFSKSAYELAEKNNIFLIDRGILIEMIVNNQKASGI